MLKTAKIVASCMIVLAGLPAAKAQDSPLVQLYPTQYEQVDADNQHAITEMCRYTSSMVVGNMPFEQVLGTVEPSKYEILMRGISAGLLEQAGKMIAAHIGVCRNIVE